MSTPPPRESLKTYYTPSTSPTPTTETLESYTMSEAGRSRLGITFNYSKPMQPPREAMYTREGEVMASRTGEAFYKPPEEPSGKVPSDLMLTYQLEKTLTEPAPPAPTVYYPPGYRQCEPEDRGTVEAGKPAAEETRQYTLTPEGEVMYGRAKEAFPTPPLTPEGEVMLSRSMEPSPKPAEYIVQGPVASIIQFSEGMRETVAHLKAEGRHMEALGVSLLAAGAEFIAGIIGAGQSLTEAARLIPGGGRIALEAPDIPGAAVTLFTEGGTVSPYIQGYPRAVSETGWIEGIEELKPTLTGEAKFMAEHPAYAAGELLGEVLTGIVLGEVAGKIGGALSRGVERVSPSLHEKLYHAFEKVGLTPRIGEYVEDIAPRRLQVTGVEDSAGRIIRVSEEAKMYKVAESPLPYEWYKSRYTPVEAKYLETPGLKAGEVRYGLADVKAASTPELKVVEAADYLKGVKEKIVEKPEAYLAMEKTRGETPSLLEKVFGREPIVKRETVIIERKPAIYPEKAKTPIEELIEELPAPISRKATGELVKKPPSPDKIDEIIQLHKPATGEAVMQARMARQATQEAVEKLKIVEPARRLQAAATVAEAVKTLGKPMEATGKTVAELLPAAPKTDVKPVHRQLLEEEWRETIIEELKPATETVQDIARQLEEFKHVENIAEQLTQQVVKPAEAIIEATEQFTAVETVGEAIVDAGKAYVKPVENMFVAKPYTPVKPVVDVSAKPIVDASTTVLAGVGGTVKKPGGTVVALPTVTPPVKPPVAPPRVLKTTPPFGFPGGLLGGRPLKGRGWIGYIVLEPLPRLKHIMRSR